MINKKAQQEIEKYNQIIMDTEKEIKRLSDKCNEDSSSLIEELDKMIKQSIIAVIANFNTNKTMRDDFISGINNLLFIREQISNNSSYKSCNNNNC